MRRSIRDAMRSTGNDHIAAIGRDLCTVDFTTHTGQATETLSVVIASYNGHTALPVTLAALQAQRYRGFEVIVVDDGSDPPIESLVCGGGLDVPVTLIRCNTNGGLACARNLGIQVAQGTGLVLLDDDMRVPPELTYAAAVRQRYPENCVFIGFREDVDESTFRDPGARRPRAERDWRCRSVRGPGEYLFLAADQQAPRIHRETFALVEDTDRFTTFGYGRVVEFWDLPGMVCGHSIHARRDEVVAAGGFDEERFVGWGAEDLALGAVLIARGNFVVPALDWVSAHPHRTGRHMSRAAETGQLRRNFARYLELIEEPVTARRFPTHPLTPARRSGGITRLTLDRR